MYRVPKKIHQFSCVLMTLRNCHCGKLLALTGWGWTKVDLVNWNIYLFQSVYFLLFIELCTETQTQ